MRLLGRGEAPGKVILCGEHAVVYGRPALAVPLLGVHAEAEVTSGLPGTGLVICALDLGEECALRAAAADHPLAALARLTLSHLGLPEPDWRVTIHSTIPVASGMGSGAAVSAALVRALAAAAGQGLPAEQVSALVYEAEKFYHGTPSGIDNTVIAYGRPVYFVRGQPPQTIPIGRPFALAVADTGVRSSTRAVVAAVRSAWEREPARYDALFDRIAEIVQVAARALAAGMPERLGPLMDENHTLLREIGVSSPELDALVAAARAAGAGGAKLSGAGRGGNVIALVTEQTAGQVVAALQAAGAARVMVTEVR